MKRNADRFLLVYHATAGSTGAYVNDLLSTLEKAGGMRLDAAVNAYYEFPEHPRVGRLLKWFYKYTEALPQRPRWRGPVLGVLRKPVRYLEVLWAYLRILCYVAFRRIDIVNLHLVDELKPTLLFFLGVRMLGARVYVTVHDTYSNFRADLSGRQRFTAQRRFVFYHAERLLTHSTHSADALVSELGIDRSRIRVIPYPAYDFRCIVKEPEAAEIERGLRTDIGKARVFLVVGWMRTNKGYDLVTAAWTRRMADRPDCRLFIVGQPCFDIGDLVRQTSRCSNVTWKPERLSDEELAAFLRVADVVVMPYRAYTNSAVLQVSYVVAGKPVICSDIPLFKCRLDEDTAMFFRSGDVDDLGRALREAADCPAERLSAKGKEGRTRFEEEAGAAVSKLLEAYRARGSMPESRPRR